LIISSGKVGCRKYGFNQPRLKVRNDLFYRKDMKVLLKTKMIISSLTVIIICGLVATLIAIQLFQNVQMNKLLSSSLPKVMNVYL
jgi:hypothetical protein